MSDEDKKDTRTSIGMGIAWAGFWLGLGIYFAADTIADKL